MPRVRVKIIRKADRAELVYRWKDPVTGRWRQRSAETANMRKAETGRARLEVELARPAAAEECLFEDFESRYADEWLSSLSAGTRITSDSAFKQVKKHLNPRLLSDITPAGIMLLESKMRDDALSEATIKGYLSHFRSALSWAESVGLLDAIPVPKRRRQKKVVSIKARGRSVTGEEFERMLAVLPDERPEDVAGFTRFLKGLWLSGLRLGESLALSWDDTAGFSIDLSSDHPRFRIWSESEKGRKDRLLPLTPDFAEFLLATPEAERTGQVFKMIGRYGKPLSPKTAGDIITAIGRRAKVLVNRQTEKFATAHDLRRSFGTRWAKRVMPAVLKELMRHEAIETTMKFYVSHDADDLARDLWRDFGPGRAEGDKTGDTKKASKRKARRRQ